MSQLYFVEILDRWLLFSGERSWKRSLRHISPGCFNGFKNDWERNSGLLWSGLPWASCSKSSAGARSWNMQLGERRRPSNLREPGRLVHEDRVKIPASRCTSPINGHSDCSQRLSHEIISWGCYHFRPWFIQFKANLLNLNSKATFVIHKLI